MKKSSSVLLFLLLFAVGATGQNNTDRLKALEDYIEKARMAWNVPGVAVAIVKDDAVVLERGFGVRTIGKPDTVDGHTMFAIASISKAFTTACLGMLVDEGKLRWDDPVTDHVPYFQMYDPYVTREMTVRDLLCHRSGSKTFGGDLIWYGTHYSREEVVRRVRHLKPSYSFRSRYGYQNIMFVAAGEIFPKITGLTWDDYVKRRILEPLGMSQTNTTVRDLTGHPNVATPHAIHKDKLITVPYRNVDNVGCDAAINSNVHDLSKWIRMWLQPDSGQILVKPETRRELWTPHTLMTLSPVAMRLFPTTHFKAAALGWFTFDYHGQKILDHGGGMDGMISKICLVPEENLGFIILTNSISSLSTALQYKILDTYLNNPETDWSAEFLRLTTSAETRKKEARKKADTERAKNTKPSLPLAAYTGTYRSVMYGDVKVTLEKQRLVASFVPTASFVGDLSHWQFDTFEIELRDPNLPPGLATFVLDASGKPSELRIDIPNPDFDFTELELRRAD